MAALMASTLGVTAASAEMRVGLGYSIQQSSNPLADDFSLIRVPIDLVGIGLRIEPEIGFMSTEFAGIDISGQSLGVGGYYTLFNFEKVNMYAGGKLGYGRVKTTTILGSDTDTFTNVQGLFGADYFFVEQMSLGAEVGLQATFGDADAISTTSNLIIRYYFLTK